MRMLSALFVFTVTFVTLTSAQEISLSKDLMPLFQRSCATCHQEDGNKDALKSGFRFEQKKEVLEGVGKIIIPSKPDESYLLYLITPPENPDQKKRVMPPAGSKSPRMSSEEIQQIKAWIEAGANDN